MKQELEWEQMDNEESFIKIMKLSKKTNKIIALLLFVIFVVIFDLGFFRHYGKYSYSVLRYLHCTTVKHEEYAHISPDSVYSSSGDYKYIYQCGSEYDKTHIAG